MEPTGFEPLTSAVQSQSAITVDVRCCSEIPAKSRIRLWKHSWMFAVVRVGWCTTGVHQPTRTDAEILASLYIALTTSGSRDLKLTSNRFVRRRGAIGRPIENGAHGFFQFRTADGQDSSAIHRGGISCGGCAEARTRRVVWT